MKHPDRTAGCSRPYAIPERNHLLLMVAFSFLIGCLSISFMDAGVWLWLLLGCGVLLAFLLHRLGIKLSAAIMLCAFALGALHTHSAFDVPLPDEGRYEIEAYVSGEVQLRTDNRISFALSDVLLDGEPVKGKGYCSLHYDDVPPELFDGAKVRFNGRVYHPDGPSGEPHFDFRMWMRQNGLSFGIAAYQEVTVENTPVSAPVKDPAFRIRTQLSGIYERLMGENGRVAMALLFGQRGGLSDEEYRWFQTLGIAHIMSVSGLHVALMGGLMLRFLRRLRVRKGMRLAVTALFLLFYCGVTGFSAAANRAAVMLMLALISQYSRRLPDRLTLLAGAMLAVLLINPLHAHTAGFVLSFCAMLGITLYATPLESFLERIRLPRSVRETFAVSLSAQLGVLIPTAAYFHQLPLYGILINMLIVPYVSAVLVPAYVLLLPLSLVPVLSHLAGAAGSFLTDVLLQLVRLFSRLPHASLRTASPPAVLGIAAGFALVMLSRRMPGSLRRRAAAAVLVLCVGLGAAWIQRPPEIRCIQLSVGQADSMLLLDGKHTVLIDTGVDADAAIDYLLDENRNIDALILTHLHIDHAGGVEALLENGIAIHQVYLPIGADKQDIDPGMNALLESLEDRNIPLSELASGDKLRYNKTGIDVLWPVRETLRIHQDANLYPLVLAIDLDGFTLLHMSDLEGVYERYCAVPADVLKAAHHGSSKSTSDAFLSFVSPSFALVSASSGSRTLPGADTLERLKAHGVSIFRTDACGDITLSVTDGQLSITPYKARTDP